MAWSLDGVLNCVLEQPAKAVSKLDPNDLESLPEVIQSARRQRDRELATRAVFLQLSVDDTLPDAPFADLVWALAGLPTAQLHARWSTLSGAFRTAVAEALDTRSNRALSEASDDPMLRLHLAGLRGEVGALPDLLIAFSRLDPETREDRLFEACRTQRFDLLSVPSVFHALRSIRRDTPLSSRWANAFPLLVELERKAAERPPDAPAPEEAEPSAFPQLEERLRANLEDREAWALYGDWLQANGDPRGELVALQLALAERPDDRPLIRRIARRMVEHDAAWFGPFADGTEDEAALEVRWHAGFWRHAALRDSHLEHLVGPFFAQPSARFLESLALWVSRERYGGPEYQPTVDALVTAGPHPGVRALFIGPDDRERWAALPRSEQHVNFPAIDALHIALIGDLAGLWAAFPNLTTLTVAGSEMRLGAIQAPSLKHLTIVSNDAGASVARELASASLPALESLELWFDPDDLEDVELGLLSNTAGLPALRHLALKRVPWSVSILDRLAVSPLLPQLERVDLTRSRLYDVDSVRAFRHLAELRIDGARLTPEVRDTLENELHNVHADYLRDADDDFYDGVFE